MNSRVTTGLGIATFLLLGSCTWDPSLSLRDHEPATDDGFEWLRRREYVRYIKTDGTESELDPATFASNLTGHCNSLMWDATEACNATYTANACGARNCATLQALCASQLLIQVAGLVSEPLEMSIGQIPPQSSATNAALLELAHDYARQAICQAAAEIRAIGGLPPFTMTNCPFAAPACDATTAAGLWGPTMPTNQQQTFARSLAVSWTEAHDVAEEAIRLAVQENLAVADRYFSELPSEGDAAELALSAPTQSRAHAAHLLIGGDEGLSGSTSAAFCTSPELTPRARAAVSLIRESAANPSSIEDSIPNSELLLGSGPSDTEAIRSRLTRLWNRTEWDGDTNANDFLDRFGIDETDFQAAREYLIREHLAFARSSTKPLPPRRIAGGGSTADMPALTLYAATARPPQLPPWSYYATLARYSSALPADSDPPSAAWSEQSLAHLLDWSLTHATNIVKSEATYPAGLADDIHDVLGLMTVDGIRQRPARLKLIYTAGSPTTLTVELHHDTSWPSSSIVAVTSPDALSCAVRAEIEGEPCTWSETAAITSGAAINVAINNNGFDVGTRFIISPPPQRVYVLRLRPGRSGLAPGSYEEVVGSWVPSAGVNYTKVVPVVPDVDRRAADIIAPSPEWCTQSHETCTGFHLGDRIPLENELSGSDGVEDSWRHYLTLARQSANEAHMLAQEVITTGLEMDLRQEQAVEELESICGSSMDTDGLVAASLGDIRSGTTCTMSSHCTTMGTTCLNGFCTCIADSGCPASHRCIANRCLRDSVAVASAGAASDTALDRLHECIGDDTILPFVSLGSRPLCLWRQNNVVCGGATQDIPCPTHAENDSLTFAAACPAMSAALSMVPGPLPVGVLVTERLGYFESDIDGMARFGGNPPCDALRRLRSGTTPGSQALRDLVDVFDSGFFDPARVREIAETIAYEARFDDYGAILVHGSPRYTTGDWTTGSPTTWPCAAAMPASDYDCNDPMTGETGSGLFCTSVTCGTRSVRAGMNFRMRRAAENVRMLTGGAMRGFRWPTWAVDLSPVGGNISTDYTMRGIREDYRLDTLGGTGSLLHNGHPGLRAYCVQAPGTAGTVVHTEIAGNPFQSTSATERSAPCPPGSSASLYIHDTHAPWFFSDSEPDPILADEIWSGLGPRAAGDNPLISQILRTTMRLDAAQVAGVPRRLYGDAGYPRFASQRVDQMTVGEVLDAMELLCEVSRADDGICDIDNPPDVQGPADLSAAARYLECVANDIERRAELSVMASVPTRAVDALRQESSTGAFPAVGGDYGAAVTRLRAALVNVAEASPLIAAELRGMSSDMEELRLTLSRVSVSVDVASVQFQSAMTEQLAACAGAARGSGDAASLVVAAYGAAVTCLNSLAQINFAAQLRDLAEVDAGLQSELALLDFNRRFSTRTTALQGLATRIATGLENIDTELAALETMRLRARRLLSKATFASSSPGGLHFAVNSVMRARHDTARVRYEQAHQNAVRMAWLARRAIEQRLGTRLSELREPLSLVAAPATWEADVCTLEGVNYDDIRESGLESTNFAEAFVGDYVTKLENVVESYRIDYPFHEADDTTVVSLRDEVHNIRAVCDAPVGNLLYYASDLDVQADPATGRPGWERIACYTSGSVEGQNCMAISALAGTSPPTSPFDPAHPDLGSVRGYRVRFGPETGSCNPPSATCGLQSTTMYAQRLTLPGGRYRISWYASAVGAGGPSAADSVRVLNDLDASVLSTGTPAETPAMDPSPEVQAIAPWKRYWLIFDLADATTVRIAIRPVVASPMLAQSIDVAGVMLEDVTRVVAGTPIVAAAHEPRMFADTSDTLTRPLPVCEDTTGAEFRSRAWRRGCIRLCSEGFGRGCDRGVAQTYCYHETQFTITAHEFERGGIIRAGGLALGNYNYRVDRVGVNFVGSAARSCEDDALPSTCYGAAYIPYSIQHLGPYTVRNHAGATYEAPLHIGNIEHGRGLAAERYITNPLSSTDRAMIEDYFHSELTGRPLDGTYVLRVWDTDGVNFEGIEDVQVVLDYRYWTRFE